MHLLTITDIKFAFSTDAEFSVVAAAMEQMGYRSLYRSLIKSAASAFGLESLDSLPNTVFKSQNFDYEEGEAEAVFPELFGRDGWLIAVIPRGGNTRLIAIKHSNASVAALSFERDLVECIQRSVDGRRIKNWRPELPTPSLNKLPPLNGHPGTNERFEELALNPAVYSQGEEDMSRILSQPHIRNAILGIARSVKTKIADAEKDLSPALIEELKQHGLVRTEYLVQCRGNSSTLCTVQDKVDLISNHGAKLRCAHCSRLFKDELITDVLSISDDCKKLLDKSHWMTVWVTSLIVAAQIPVSAVSWNASIQSDEIDIIVDVFGAKIFFELKDREFGLGDAYPFNHRFRRYGGDYGVVITTETIALEAAKFFKEQSGSRSAPVKFFSRDSDVPGELRTYVGVIAVNTLVTQLTRHLGASGVNEAPWIREWLK